MKPEAAAPVEGGSLPGSTLPPMPPDLALIRSALVASRERIDWLLKVIDGEEDARRRAREEMDAARREGQSVLEAVMRRLPAAFAGEARRLAENLGGGDCVNPPRGVKPPAE